MGVRLVLLAVNAVLINAAFLLAFLMRYGLPFPALNFKPYKENFLFLTFVYLLTLAFAKMYKGRFCSYWDLFVRVFYGMFLGTLFGVSLVYVFRIKWGSFPSSIFLICFPLGILLIFTVNGAILRWADKIKKKVIIIGDENLDDTLKKASLVEQKNIASIEELTRNEDVDEVIISKKIYEDSHLNLLSYLLLKSKVNVLFSPKIYAELLSGSFGQNNSVEFLATSLGRKSELEEFLIRTSDIAGSLAILITTLPLTVVVAIFVKLSSSGSVFYKQQRIGKNGKPFALYKFRTMVKDAEKISGFLPATENDPRVTKTGKWLRRTRLDELPQLLNVIKGEMSLVGPRPENLYRVENHKALQELRLAVKPGLTGLAQIRSFYNLHPKHKIKYDYLYIQRRNLLLNLYILAKTIPVLFSKKGW